MKEENKKENEAMFWKREKENIKNIRCVLCPQNCSIPEDKSGFCGARKNKNSRLISLVYGRPCSVNLDPIEKKPLYHFLPGASALSIGTLGCNLACSFCQNWEISRANPERFSIKLVSPKQVIEIIKKNNAKIIAYTYTEPTIFYEYMLDIAKLAKKESIKNVIVSNGFINEEPLKNIVKYIDAANIDLKAFDDDFYKKNCSGKLEPVLKTLRILKKNNIWLEITNLIIPGKNDDMNKIEEMCIWISKELGKEVPIHFSRFFPMHKMNNKEPTSIKTLEKAAKIAKKYLDYVYVGNIQADNNTYCPKCSKEIISRINYTTSLSLKQNKCICGQDISGIF